jgi:hypothetical protein
MGWPASRFTSVCGLLLTLAGCNYGDVGYIEIKTTSAAAAPALYLDSDRLAQMRGGVSVLRERVGERRLHADLDGGKVPLCTIVVKKNRITSVTISPFDRPPRCNCGRDGTPAGKPSERTCIS